MMVRLEGAARDQALTELAHWQAHPSRDAITRSFRFHDFAEAFAFMTRVALAAEKADHHPEWSNVWNRVDILLTTHSADGLTMKDAALARRIDAIAAQLALDARGH